MKALMALMICAVLMNKAIAAKDENPLSGLTASVLVEPGSGDTDKNKGNPKFIPIPARRLFGFAASIKFGGMSGHRKHY